MKTTVTLLVTVFCFLGTYATAATSIPTRVVSMAPSITETIVALGLEHRLVGVSTYCQIPPHLEPSIVRAGGYVDPELETILSLRPDLVMTPPNPSFETALARFSIPFKVFQSQWTTMDNILSSITEIGEVLGERGAAEKTVGAIAATLSELTDKSARSPNPVRSVLLVIEKQPGMIMAAGPGSHLDELLAIAGGVNVVTNGPPYPNLPSEVVMTLNPDVIIDASDDLSQENSAQAVSAWKELATVSAVQNGQIHAVPPDQLVVPGPGIGSAARLLYGLLHDSRAESPESVQSEPK